MSTKRVSIALRIPEPALDHIDEQAQAHNLSRTDYMVRSATGQLHNTTAEAMERIEALEQAVQRLQDYAYAAS